MGKCSLCLRRTNRTFRLNNKEMTAADIKKVPDAVTLDNGTAVCLDCLVEMYL